MNLLAKIGSKLNFYNGFVIGFTSMWIIPRKTFDKLAIFYYDLTEIDDVPLN